MLKFLVDRILEGPAKRYGYDTGYMKAIYAASPRGFWTFANVAKLSAHREAVSIEACYAAKLVGTLAEDCGSCTQLVVHMAREARMSDAQIEAVLRADLAVMSADTALGYRFACAILARSADGDAAREAVRARWGDKGVVDLTYALQASRLFPMVKAGLGFMKSCQAVQLGSRSVVTTRHAV
jgi:hypothetical protein